MSKVFDVYLRSGDSELELSLPATDYTLLDAQERLGLDPGEVPDLEVTNISEVFDYLDKRMQDRPDLYMLNALARRLDELNGHGRGAFEGMVGMHIQRDDTPLTVAALIDMTCNTECCHIAPGVSTDYELGRFYAENGFVEEVEGLEDAAFELLDFGRIGQKFRQSEGGVFTSLGYVMQDSSPEPVAEKMDFAPQKPDYVFRVGVRKNHDNASPGEVSVLLPTSEAIIQALPGILGVGSLNDAWMSSFDGPIPQLEDAVRSPADLSALNELASKVKTLDEAGKLPCFKAVLLAKGCDDVNTALALSRTVDEYVLSDTLRTAEGVAMRELINSQCPDPDILLKHLDLDSYGRDLIAQQDGLLTDFGLLERKDGQPIHDIGDEPIQGGMEMM